MASQQRTHELIINKTPLAIIDMETTGLYEGADRVVELAIVRFDPVGGSTVLIDTLINPQRQVSGTEIHGITDDDVRDAPLFSEIAPDVLEAISGCVVASYNIYFDLRFLIKELLRAGERVKLPHLCLMYMRPLLGLGARVRLEVACQTHGVAFQHAHSAIGDAIAATGLYEHYLPAMAQCRVNTFGDLANNFGKSYKFFDSFNIGLPDFSAACTPGNRPAWKRRGGNAPVVAGKSAEAIRPRNPQAIYWEALTTVLSDLEITDSELTGIVQLQKGLGLSVDELRYLHGRVFAAVLSQFSDDKRLDDKECARLRRLHQCLAQLGWAPGL